MNRSFLSVSRQFYIASWKKERTKQIEVEECDRVQRHWLWFWSVNLATQDLCQTLNWSNKTEAIFFTLEKSKHSEVFHLKITRITAFHSSLMFALDLNFQHLIDVTPNNLTSLKLYFNSIKIRLSNRQVQIFSCIVFRRIHPSIKCNKGIPLTFRF